MVMNLLKMEYFQILIMLIDMLNGVSFHRGLEGQKFGSFYQVGLV